MADLDYHCEPGQVCGETPGLIGRQAGTGSGCPMESHVLGRDALLRP